jgi:zinc transporter ZupT
VNTNISLPILSFVAELLPFGLGIAAGTMLYLVFSELIPEAMLHLDRVRFCIIFASTFVFMGQVSRRLAEIVGGYEL